MPHPTIPPCTPIVYCPRCGVHTAHTMAEGHYVCEVCSHAHTNFVPHATTRERPQVHCPTCQVRRQHEAKARVERRLAMKADPSPEDVSILKEGYKTWVPVWAPVAGSYQCRVCQTKIPVAS